MYVIYIYIQLIFSPFSPFTALCGIAGLAEAFPFVPFHGPYLLDPPGCHVSSESAFPSQHVSSYKALSVHLSFGNCSNVFCFISSFHVLLLVTITIGFTFVSYKIFSFLLCRIIFIYVVAVGFSSVINADHVYTVHICVSSNGYNPLY